MKEPQLLSFSSLEIPKNGSRENFYSHGPYSFVHNIENHRQDK